MCVFLSERTVSPKQPPSAPILNCNRLYRPPKQAPRKSASANNANIASIIPNIARANAPTLSANSFVHRPNSSQRSRLPAPLPPCHSRPHFSPLLSRSGLLLLGKTSGVTFIGKGSPQCGQEGALRLTSRPQAGHLLNLGKCSLQ